MKIKHLLVISVILVASFVMISCNKDSDEAETEPTTVVGNSSVKDDEVDLNDITYSNDDTDSISKKIFKTMLGDNDSADEVVYNLTLATKIDDYVIRYEVFDNSAVTKKGYLTGKNVEDETVTISASIGKKVRYYKFVVLGKENAAIKMLDIYGNNLLHNTDDVRDNITLVDKTGLNNNIAVTWKLKDDVNADIITMTATGDNGEIPAGVITRGDIDKKVTLVATASVEIGGELHSKDFEYELTIKAKPEEKTYEAYIYTYFQGNIYGKGESQHIHLAVSKDGYFWDDLNDNKPVLKAEKGTKGVRDSFLIRSPYGDKFYLIGTDLDANGGDWGAYANNGSKAIRVWESTDLVNWSEERLIDIAPKGAGCMWAPECFYDESTGEYVVYFATGIVGGNGKKIYYVKTRDFYTFTEAKVFKDVEDGITFIDTSITKYNGVYYRFTKNENEITILVEKSDKLLGEYSLITTRIANQWGVEGPGIYKINGEEKWCLYMDGYANENAGVGYFPLIAESLEDLEKGNFRRLKDGEFKMPDGAKHGSFVPITMEEYNALVEKWGI